MSNQIRNYSPRIVAQQLAEPDEQPVTATELDVIFLYVMRCPAIFAEARPFLDVSHFDRINEAHYAILWSTICELQERYHGFTYETLAAAIMTRLAADPSCLSDADRVALLQDDSQGIIWSALHCDASELLPDFGRDVLRKFLRERQVVRPLRAIMNRSTGSGYIQSFGEMLRAAVAEVDRIETIREAPVGCAMPARGSALPPPIEYTPTGLGYIDRTILGQRKGDCNGILGVYGSGKTTLGIHMAVENARNYAYIARAANKRPQLSVFLSYEEPASKVQPRVWANAAKIRRDKLENFRWEDLTTGANLEPYELRLDHGNALGGAPLSETDRWDSTALWLNQSFVMLDMSGSEAHAGAGKGFVPEIVALLERLITERQTTIGCVISDYAGLMCRRYMEAQNISDDRMRFYVGGLGDRMRREVSEHFDCTTWLLHQFNGEQNKRSPTLLLTHTDAAESKGFAENMAVCLCLGTRDPATGCLLLNCSKCRYNPTHTQQTPTLQINGMFCEMLDVSDRFVPDAALRGFTDPATSQQIQGGGTVSRGPVSNGPPGRNPGLTDLGAMGIEF